MKHTASLTQGNILQVLLRFSIPFLLANLLQALYGAADLMIIRRKALRRYPPAHRSHR